MNKNILITGGAGYIGSQLIRDLPRTKEFRDSKIIILDNMNEEKYISLMDLKMSNCRFYLGDIRDLDTVAKLIKNVDIIIHLAALTDAPKSFDNRKETEAINYQGTMNIIRKAIESGVKRFIYASTTSVYGPTNGKVTETSKCKPASPYAFFKLKAEKEIMKLAKNKKINVTSLRFATVFGFSPGIRFHTVLNKFVFLSCIGYPLTIYGTGDQKRPFLHVKDAVKSIIFSLLENKTKNEIFNVVGENASVNEIVEMIRNYRGDINTIRVDREILNQISYTVDSSKIKNRGYKPNYTIKDGIQELISKFNSFSRESD